MIPILYENTETSFTTNGLCRLRDCISCVVTEERNGIFECDFEYPVTGANFELIKCGRIITVEHDYSNDVQPFDIVSYSKPINGVVSFHAVHISYRQSGIVVNGSNINTLEDAFDLLATGQPSNPFTYSTDKESATGFVAAANGVPRSVRQMLGGIEGSILDTFGGEYKFDRFSVELLAARGQPRDLTIRYGVNLLDYQEDSDYSETFSSVVPFWTGTDENGVETVVIGDYTSSGETTYSGRDDAIALDCTDKFEETPTKADLNSFATSYLSANNTILPQRSIAIDFVRLSETLEYNVVAPLLTCSLCDSIQVIFPEFGMSGLFKIVKTEFNVLLEKFNNIELGALRTSLADALGLKDSLGFSGGGGALSDISINGTILVGNKTSEEINVVDMTTPRLNLDTTATSGTDHAIYNSLVSLGWTDVIV